MCKLDNLTSEQIERLMNEYYAGTSIKQLLSDYKLQIQPSQLYKHFPPKKFDAYICEYCSMAMVANRKSKTNNNYYESDLYCLKCNHTLKENCNCYNCLNKRKEKEETKKAMIAAMYDDSSHTIFGVDDISFENKVYLGALCRMACSEDMTKILPYMNCDKNRPLTPDDTHTGDILCALIESKLISVSSSSSIDTFVEDDTFPNNFYPFYATYVINVSKEDLAYILSGKFYDEGNLKHKDTALKIWKKIAVEECVQYLKYQLSSVNLDRNFKAGELTYKIFEEILGHFSVSQIYGIIWRSVANASKLYLEGNYSILHAANTTIGNCQRYADKAVLHSWNLKGYSRIKELPQCELGIFLYDKVLEIGDLGFHYVPSEL